MKQNLIGEKLLESSHPTVAHTEEPDFNDRLKAMELQLKMYKQAEAVGEMGYWQINLDTFESWYSENIFRIYGVEPNSLHQHPETFNQFIHPADLEIVSLTFEKSYLEKIPLHLEFRIIRQDGEERHIAVVSNVTKNTRGEQLLTGITQDITNRKNLELQLRQVSDAVQLQNEASRQAEQIARFGTWQINLNTRQTHYSENFFRILGMRPLPVPPGLDYFIEFLHPDDKDVLSEVINKIFDQQQEAEAEFRVLRYDGRLRNVRLKCSIIKNAEGDLVVLGVMVDTTTQTQLQNQLKHLSEEFLILNETFTQAEKSLNIGTWTWNVSTDVIHFSDHIYVLFGIKPKSVRPVFESFDPYMHPLDRSTIYRMLDEMKQQPGEYNFSFRIVRHDTKRRYLRMQANSVTTAEGIIVMVGTIQDVTEEVLLNQQVRERTSFAKMLSENIIDKVCITDSFNNVIGWNTSSEAAFKLSKAEVIGKNIFEVFPQLKSAETVEQYKKVLNGEVVHIPLFVHPYTEGYHDLTMIPIKKDDQEQVTAVLSLLHDMTEHQKLKEDLEDRLNFIEKLLESSVDRIIVLDRKMQIVYWNDKSAEFHGLRKEQVLGRSLIEVFPQLRQEQIFAQLKQALKGETIHVPVDKESYASVYADSFLIPIKNTSQQVAAILWITHDLTDLIQAEREIKKRNYLLQQSSEIAHLGSWELDLTGNKLVWSDEIYHIYGYPVQSFEPTLDFFYSTTDPQDRAVLETTIEKASAGSAANITIRIRTVDGRTRHVLCLIKPMVESAQVHRLIGTVQDITDQKSFEQSLLQRSYKIRRLKFLEDEEETLRRSGSWQWKVTTGEMVWSEGMFNLFGVNPFSIIPNLDNLLSLVRKEEKAYVLDELRSMQSVDIDRNIFEFSIEHHGEKKYIRCVGRMVNYTEKLVVGSMYDVTEIVALQRQLDEKIELIEQLVDSKVDVIMGFDKEMNVIVWNKLAESIFKHSKSEAIGISFFNIFEEGAHRETILNHIRRGFYGELTYQSGTGAEGPLNYSSIRYIPLGKENNIYAVLLMIHGVRVHTN